MDPIIAQLIAASGPSVVQFLIENIRMIKDKSPESITPAQWEQLRDMFKETYEDRKARIEASLRQAGQLGG